MTLSWPRPSRVLFVFSLAILVALLWFLGPHLGLASVASRLAGILLLLLLTVTFLLVKALRGAQSQAAPPPPTAPRWLAQARDQVLRAVRTLKATHLGRVKGNAALYELPWVMVLGHEGAGSTEAIRQSGLTFPLSQDRDATLGELEDLKTFSFAFATEGVLLDAPGRFLAPDTDPAEWVACLRLLQTHRPGGPLEGILVTLGLPELLHPDAAALTAKAQQFRRRISEAEHCLGHRIPIYLMIAKLDLLPGFTSFFGDLDEEERKQPWGAALPQVQGPDFDPVQAMEDQLVLLHQGLIGLGSARLAQESANLDRPALSTFPLAFHQLSQALCAFTEQLVGLDPYHPQPFLRGFYFTSANQSAGESLAEPVQLISGFELSAPAKARPEAAPNRPFFLEQLFRQVIFPDRFLAANLGTPRRYWRRLGWMGAGLAALSLLTAAWTWSFLGNRKLCAAVREELRQAQALSASPRLEDRMQALMVLQRRLEGCRQERLDGRPWALRWGLHQGPALERTCRRQYFPGVSSLMLTPVRKQLEETLAGTARAPRPPRPRQLPPAVPRRPILPKDLIPDPITRVSYLVPSELPARPVQPRASQARPKPAEADRSAEHLYNTLKTYLMLSDRSLMEADHLTHQLPRCWRPFLEASHPKQGQAGLLRMAERTVAFYVSQLKAPDLPVIGNRPELVAEARQRLRTRMPLHSPVKQLYNGLKAKGNTDFEPMTVGRMLKDRDLDLIAASHAVPGSFTREAYEQFFRAAIQEAGQGQLRLDWVLAATPHQEPGQDGAQQAVQSELEAIYKAEYQREWDTFLQGLALLDFGNLGGASAALGRLGDPQSSPLKLILERASLETAWDNPGTLEKQFKNVTSKVIARTEQFLGPKPPGAEARYGELGSKFSALAILATKAEGGAAPIDGYLQLLQKARTRLGAIALAGDPYSLSREYLQCTLLGAGSELAEAQQYVDIVLLARVDGHGQELLRPILLRPLIQAYAALIPAAEQDINRAWTQQVWSAWNALAGKYPFADSGNEATMADLHKFLKPGEGTLPQFVDKYLGPLVERQGDRLLPKFWAGRGIAFQPAFLEGVARLCLASSSLREAAASRFELQPVPTPGLSEILLEIDGQKLLYRNGPQAWTAFSWPGQSSLQGARLQVVTDSGAPAKVHNTPGRLGLLRLLDRARVDDGDTTTHTLAWPCQPSPASAVCQLRFNLRMVSGPDPLALSALRHHALPSRAIR